MNTSQHATVGAGTWQIDPMHTHVEFAVRHLMIATVRGRFRGVSGTIIAPDGDFAAAEVHAVVETATIDTGDSQRDAHLKSAQFLDVESYPTMTFRSRRVERSRRDPAKYAMAGDLTLHGVTRTVILDAMFGGEVRDSWGNQRIGFTATSTISRKAFGLTWNELLESGGVAVGDDVMITIDTEIVAAPAAAASERGA